MAAGKSRSGSKRGPTKPPPVPKGLKKSRRSQQSGDEADKAPTLEPDTDSWASDVVEGAAAAKAGGASHGDGESSDAGNQGAEVDGLVHEAEDDEDESHYSSPLPDKAPPGAGEDEADTGDSDLSDPDPESPEVSVEGLIADLERVTEEKNQYLDASRRLQADFENYRKRVGKDTSEAKARGKESVISELLDVLDACDGAVASGSKEVEPIRSALLKALASQGVRRIDPVDSAFDPAEHEAIAHEPGEDGEAATVAEVMRAGYGLDDRVIRPAMVRVRG